jgi:hypothetical protein
VHLGLRSTQFLAWPSTWAGSAWAGSPLLKSRGALAAALGGGAQSIPSMANSEGVGIGNGIERSSPMLSMTVNLGGRGMPVREVGRWSLVRLAGLWSIAGRQRSSVRCRSGLRLIEDAWRRWGAHGETRRKAPTSEMAFAAALHRSWYGVVHGQLL